jgi:hypothetical protein
VSAIARANPTCSATDIENPVSSLDLRALDQTTLARQLEQRIPAIRFSHDEWMARLYGDDPPVELPTPRKP